MKVIINNKKEIEYNKGEWVFNLFTAFKISIGSIPKRRSLEY